MQRVLFYFRTMTVIISPMATISSVRSAYRTINAQGAGNASLSRLAQRFIAMAANAVSAASLIAQARTGRTLSAAVTGVAWFDRKISLSLNAVATGVATLTYLNVENLENAVRIVSTFMKSTVRLMMEKAHAIKVVLSKVQVKAKLTPTVIRSELPKSNRVTVVLRTSHKVTSTLRKHILRIILNRGD